LTRIAALIAGNNDQFGAMCAVKNWWGGRILRANAAGAGLLTAEHDNRFCAIHFFGIKLIQTRQKGRTLGCDPRLMN
jgi:hypothetical protein